MAFLSFGLVFLKDAELAALAARSHQVAPPLL
jgi:hypothetical protein